MELMERPSVPAEEASAIHRMVIFSTFDFVKCLKNFETTDIDDTRSIKYI